MLEKETVYNLRNRSVKRMLWPVDHEQTKRDLRSENQKLQKEITEKYNFDFTSGKPMHGKYDWVAVGLESPISSPCLINEDHNKNSCSTSQQHCSRVCNVENSKRKTKRSSTITLTETQTKCSNVQKRRNVFGKPTKRRRTITPSRTPYSLRRTTSKYIFQFKFLIKLHTFIVKFLITGTHLQII